VHPSQGHKEGSTIPRRLNHYGGAEPLGGAPNNCGGRQKVSTLSQVLSSMQVKRFCSFCPTFPSLPCHLATCPVALPDLPCCPATPCHPVASPVTLLGLPSALSASTVTLPPPLSPCQFPCQFPMSA